MSTTARVISGPSWFSMPQNTRHCWTYSSGVLARADAEIRVPVEHAAYQNVREKSLCAPDVRRGTCDDRVAPYVAIAGEIWRLIEEAVVQVRQVRCIHRL